MTDLPDTPENAAFFGRPSSAVRDGAFPQVRWVAAAESGTGALTGAAFGRYTAGEQALALDLLPSFRPGMVVLADRNFLSHALARDVLATGAHILWRASASFALRPVRTLADGTYLAELRPARKADGPPATVRVIEYAVHTETADQDRGSESSPEVFALVTDLLDVELYPALTWPALTRCGGLRDRHRPPQDRHGRRPAGAAQQGPRGRRPGDVGTVRRLPGHLPAHRHRRERHGHPTGHDQLPPALAAAASTITAAFPLTSLTSTWPPSC